MAGAQRTWMAGTSARSKASSPRPAMTDRRQDPSKVTSCHRRALPSAVMPGLVPGIHVLAPGVKNVDGRDEPGHDGGGCDTDRATQFADAKPRAFTRGRSPARRLARP